MCDMARLKAAMAEGHDFVAWAMQNGHRHTCRAFGENMPAIDSAGNEGNEAYINYVCKNESTELQEILYADSVEEALEEDIIYESGDPDVPYNCY